MDDLKTDLFKVDAGAHFTIVDEHGNRWKGEADSPEMDFVFLCINSHDSDLNIVRFNISDIDNVDKYEFDQLAENTNEDELRGFIKENTQYFKDLLDYKIQNPESNGEL